MDLLIALTPVVPFGMLVAALFWCCQQILAYNVESLLTSGINPVNVVNILFEPSACSPSGGQTESLTCFATDSDSICVDYFGL